MNGFVALCIFIATFSPPLGVAPLTPPAATVLPTDIFDQLQTQDARIDGPRIQGVIYFDGPIPGNAQRIRR
ncbi:MAG: hypothetical protein GXP26_02040 [Planctomycetes bacterium]|nr:hypothetical protein [Planctomycetota bacterium]